MSISFRGSDINVYPNNHTKSYSSIWPFVNGVHCNSKELAEKLVKQNIPLSIPVSIIPAALRPEFSTPLKKSKYLNQLGTTFNPTIIVSLGRLHWVKDYPLSLRIMAKLKKTGFKFKYYILGDGPDKEQLLFLCNELDIQDEVVLAGKVSTPQIQHFFEKAHVYLQTSYAEGFSNACLEAQAFGIPCVVPAISGMDVCVENEKTGLIVQERDEHLFVKSIKYLVDNYQLFDPDYISERVRTEFSIERQRKSWLYFFSQFNH